MENINAPEIGPILQRQRKQHGLTLEQLAGLSGVSKSMLSQIERGQANPTFAVLWSLTRALRIDLAELANDPLPADEAIELVSAGHTPEIRSADGLCRLRILSPPRLAGGTEWYQLEIAAGGILDSPAHAAGAAEHLTVFAGALEVHGGGAVRAVAAGETARYRADQPHRLANPSSGTATGLLVVLYR